jgi:hypothetical protein
MAKTVAPEGLSKAEVEAWEASLPEPADEKTERKDTAHRLDDVEARLTALEHLLNVKLDPDETRPV